MQALKQQKRIRSTNSRRKHKPRAPSPGKFWPQVRGQIWIAAQQLFQEENQKTMSADFNGTTAENYELVESGYFYRAKLITLRQLYREKKGLPPEEEEWLMQQQESS